MRSCLSTRSLFVDLFIHSLPLRLLSPSFSRALSPTNEPAPLPIAVGLPPARPIPPPAAVMAAVGSPFALAFRIIHSGPLTLATTLVPARRARFLMGLPGASARVSGSLPSFFRSACPTCKWPTMPGMRRRSGQRGRWSRSCRSSTIPLTLPVRRLAPYDAFKMQQLMLRSAPSFKSRDEAERRYPRICLFLTQQWYTLW